MTRALFIKFLFGIMLLCGCAKHCLKFNESTSHEYREYRICRNGTFHFKSVGHLSEHVSRGSARFDQDKVYINSWNDSTSIIIDSVVNHGIDSIYHLVHIRINGAYNICNPAWAILLNGKAISFHSSLMSPNPIDVGPGVNILQISLIFDTEGDCLIQGVTFFSKPFSVKSGDNVYVSFNEYMINAYTMIADSFMVSNNRLTRF